MHSRCEDFQRIDVRKIDFRIGTPWQYPDGIAVAVVGGAVHVIHGNADFYVSIKRTGCNYGGSRPWFLCPLCGDRRAVLYGDVSQGSVFGCRRCMCLRYASEAEDTFARLERKRRKLEAKLGYGGEKPKWMRLSTFEQLHFKKAKARADAARWLVRKFCH